MFLSLRKHVRHWSNPLGRYFFQSERDDRTTPVWRAPEGTITAPVDGGGAWPGFETTRRAEGSRRGRLAGGPPPTGTQSSPAQQDSTPGAQNTSGATSNNSRRYKQHR